MTASLEVVLCKLNLAALRIVRSKTYVAWKGPSQHDKKLHNRAVIGVYISFNASNTYMLWIPPQSTLHT
jgi:hypothetical protein